MILRRVFAFGSKRIIRKYSQKPLVSLSEDVSKSIDNQEYKPKKHPGITSARTVELPDEYIKAIECTCGDFPIKRILKDSVELVEHLKNKVPPMEEERINETRDSLLKGILSREGNVEFTTREEQEKFKSKVRDKLQHLMKKKIYNWKPVNYNEYNSLVYMIGRSAQEYAVLVQILSEIQRRDANFKPRSLFDFGSGVGTGSWAVKKFWNKSIFEYFNVDVSASMNDLAYTLLQGGRGNRNTQLKGVFYRQFFPHQNVLYDIVLSAYSLLELPSFEQRMETILRLWNKTEKYLVLVEVGTNAGFKVITEARDFILKLEGDSKGHVFSPCPHDHPCPRFLNEDKTPCNFSVQYMPLPFGKRSEYKNELYSYVVLKKGPRSSNDEQWPRIVRTVLVRSKHSICRLCTANGKLEEIIFTASKHGKSAYHCARSSKWGDRIPVKIENPEES